MCKVMLTFFMYLLTVPFSQGQITVSTIAGPGSGIDDALIMDKHGNLYGSHFGNPASGGGTIYKIDPDGNKTVFASGFAACNGLALDKSGNLFAVEFAANSLNSRVYKIDSLGNKSAFGPKIPGASGLIIDPDSDTLYVSQYTSGQGNRISKLDPDGNLTLFCNASGLNGPVGMTFDHNKNMYVANFNNGNIYRVFAGGDSITRLASLPFATGWGIGFITYASGYLYATGIGVHKIFRVSLTGEVSVLAGSGAVGTIDGAGDVAKFNRPNGITTNYAQDRLYISEYASSSVREISGINEVSSTNAAGSTQKIGALRCTPNPSRDQSRIMYEIQKSGSVHIAIFNMSGEIVETLENGYKSAGHHEFIWNTTGVKKGTYVCRASYNHDEQQILIFVQ